MIYNSTSWPTVVCSLLLTFAASPSLSFADDETVDLNPKIVSGFIENHCQKCHGPEEQEGELRLDTLSLNINSSDLVEQWGDVSDALKFREMPPEDEPRPDAEELNAVRDHLKKVLKLARVHFKPIYQYKSEDLLIPRATAEEPKVKAFTAETIRAASKYLDDGAVAWTRSKKCVTCHTNGTYMAERPGLTPFLGKPNEEVLKTFQRVPRAKAPVAKKKSRNRPGFGIVWQSLGLAQWDKHVTGETSDLTERALRSMLMQQQENGSWKHIRVTEIPHITTEFQLTVQAARAVAAAPGWLDQLADDDLRQRVERMKSYLREHEPRNDFELALKLQLAGLMPGAVVPSQRDEAIAMLRGKQQADGGWSMRSMSDPGNWRDRVQPGVVKMLQSETEAEKAASDPYMTGFAIVALRQSGVPASDEQIQRGITWLKTNQRESGRWWMKSMYRDTYHFSTYIGTAQALKALALCGELESAASTRVSANK